MSKDSETLIVDRVEEAMSEFAKTIDSHRGEILLRIEAMVTLMQREWLKNLRREQRMLEAVCPSVFTISPTGRQLGRSVLGTRYHLRLYCEFPAGWHAAPGEPYREYLPAKWFRVIAPHVNSVIAQLRRVTPFMMATVGLDPVFDQEHP